jgi:1,4-dihydroxy-2-naphthoyl-CoA hydrolase
MTTKNAAYFNRLSEGYLPGLLGMEILEVSADGVHSRLTVRADLMAGNGYLHAATVVALADTSCGYGCVARLPEGASGFTTVELKANFLGTTREGVIDCRASAVHLGRTTHVWDALVCAGDTRLAAFRCTQMILWPK